MRRSFLTLTLIAGLAACQRPPGGSLRLVPQINPVLPRRVAFSPTDGDRLLILEASGLVGIWDIARPWPPRLFSSVAARAIDAAFSPDGRFVVTASLDGRLRYWRVDGHLVWVSQGGHAGRVRAVTVAEDFIASGGEDGSTLLWRLDGSLLSQLLPAQEGAIVSLAVSAGGDVVSLAADDSVRLWKRSAKGTAERPSFEPTVLQPRTESTNAAQFLRQASFNPSWGWDHSVAFSPDGNQVAAALFDASVRLWNSDGSTRAVVVDAHQKRPVRALAFAPQGDVIASAGFDGTVRWWTPDGSTRGDPLQAHGAPIFSVAFSPRGDRFATAGGDDRVRIWNRDGSAWLVFPRDANEHHIAGVALAPHSALLAAADDAGGVRLWTLDGIANGDSLSGSTERPWPLAFSSDDVLAAPGRDRSVRLWNSDATAHGQPLQIAGSASALAFSPDDATLAVGTEGVQLWKNGQRLWQKAIRISDYVQTIAFAPQGDFIVTGSWLGAVQVWNLDGSTRALRPKQQREFVTSVAVAPDGEYIVAAIGGVDTVVQPFNLDLSPRGVPLEGHRGVIAALAFSPTGQLVAGGADGVVRLWTLPSRQLESFEVGRAINQLGYWHDLLWVRTADDPGFLHDAPRPGGTVIFYDAHYQLVATLVLSPHAALAFTPDGWFSGTGWPTRRLRLYRESGQNLRPADIADRRSPQAVIEALTKR